MPITPPGSPSHQGSVLTPKGGASYSQHAPDEAPPPAEPTVLPTWRSEDYMSSSEFRSGDGRTRLELLQDSDFFLDETSALMTGNRGFTVLSRSTSAPRSLQSDADYVLASEPETDQSTDIAGEALSWRRLFEREFERMLSLNASDGPSEFLDTPNFSRAPSYIGGYAVHARLDGAEPKPDESSVDSDLWSPLRLFWSPSHPSWEPESIWTSENTDFDHEGADIGSVAHALLACGPERVLVERAALVSGSRESALAAYNDYSLLNGQSFEADRRARQTYGDLLESTRQRALAVHPDQLRAAHAAALEAAYAHSGAELAARYLRTAYVVYATQAFSAGDLATSGRAAFLSRGREALQVVRLALLAELNHRLLAAVFGAITRTNDPCQPLQPEHSFLLADPGALEHFVRLSARIVPYLNDAGEADETTASSATTYDEVLAAANEDAHAWGLYLAEQERAQISEWIFMEAQAKELDWIQDFLGLFRVKSPRIDGLLRDQQKEVTTAIRQSVVADVSLQLREASQNFLAGSATAFAAAALAYSSCLEHLIRIALAAPHGALPFIPSTLEIPAVLRYFTDDLDPVSNARSIQTNALRALDDASNLMQKLIPALLMIQSVPAFRFKNAPNA